MAGLVDIKFDERKIKRLEKKLGTFKNKMPRVMSQSINKVTTTARAEAARQIAGKIKVRVTTVKKRTEVVRATFRRLLSTITFSPSRIPLIEFQAKWSQKRGVSYRIQKTGKRERAPRAFIRTMTSGHRGVFKRKPKGRNNDQLVARRPIVELRGPSIKQVFRDAPAIAAAVLAKVAPGLEKEIVRRVKLILEKR